MRIAVTKENNIIAFNYSHIGAESEVNAVYEVDVPKEFVDVYLASGQLGFCYKDGQVIKRTDEDLRTEPRFIEYLAECRKERYKNETDYLKEKVIEILAKESKDPIVMEWIKGKAKIREEVK